LWVRNGSAPLEALSHRTRASSTHHVFPTVPDNGIAVVVFVRTSTFAPCDGRMGHFLLICPPFGVSDCTRTLMVNTPQSCSPAVFPLCAKAPFCPCQPLRSATINGLHQTGPVGSVLVRSLRNCAAETSPTSGPIPPQKPSKAAVCGVQEDDTRRRLAGFQGCRNGRKGPRWHRRRFSAGPAAHRLAG
jgi:hypothetical protein